MVEVSTEGTEQEVTLSFGCENLFIADGSIVPANLGVNPALTITALSKQVMAGIPENPNSTPRPAPRAPIA